MTCKSLVQVQKALKTNKTSRTKQRLPSQIMAMQLQCITINILVTLYRFAQLSTISFCWWLRHDNNMPSI